MCAMLYSFHIPDVAALAAFIGTDVPQPCCCTIGASTAKKRYTQTPFSLRSRAFCAQRFLRPSRPGIARYTKAPPWLRALRGGTGLCPGVCGRLPGRTLPCTHPRREAGAADVLSAARCPRVSLHNVKWQAVVFFVYRKISTGRPAHVDVVLAR